MTGFAGHVRTRGALLAACCLGLVALVLAAYSRAGGFGFVTYDDPDYVLDNPWVNRGLSWEGLRWAFTSAHASNWHPLTWLAHMLDFQLFGPVPAGHHLSSVVLHALNALLCLGALHSLTGRLAPSALVAGLFAVHPLRVESVAWVSERKDVLAGCFFFLLLLAYARHARAPSARSYACVVGALVLGLLSKPMLVTAPAVLLLLDFWPNGRLGGRLGPRSSDPASPTIPSLAPTRPGKTQGAGGGFHPWLEKLPLFLLAGLSSVATVVSQRLGGSLYPLAAISLGERLANAPLAVLRYLGHFAWPVGLTYFYPHAALVETDRATPWTTSAIAALLVVIAVSATAVLARRRLPALFVGWFWFLGMLLPVIGLVQVGEQALADRYAYLPLVGVQLALVFTLTDLARAGRMQRLLGIAGAALLVPLCAATYRQAAFWHDSETLYRRALAVDERNYAAHVGLANELSGHGDVEGARTHFGAALDVRPTYAPALYSLGLLEQQQGNAERAIELYRRAVEALPEFAAARLNLGGLLARRGDLVDAALEFEAVIALLPDHPDAHFNLAQLLLVHGQTESAIEHLEAAVRARDDAFAAWQKLGEAYESLGRHADALHAFDRAARDGGNSIAAARLAWLLATAREDELRDAARALELAQRAVRLSKRQDADALESLAAAWAESGDFARATSVEEEALQLLPPGRRAAAESRLGLYRSRRPFRHDH